MTKNSIFKHSHLIVVPPGVLPTDAIMASPIMRDSMGGAMPGAATGGGSGGAPMPSSDFAEFGGVDPSLDPELAMAIRVSTEEARAREEARVS